LRPQGDRKEGPFATLRVTRKRELRVTKRGALRGPFATLRASALDDPLWVVLRGVSPEGPLMGVSPEGPLSEVKDLRGPSV